MRRSGVRCGVGRDMVIDYSYQISPKLYLYLRIFRSRAQKVIRFQTQIRQKPGYVIKWTFCKVNISTLHAYEHDSYSSIFIPRDVPFESSVESVSERFKQICVIGAGAAGLAALKVIADMPQYKSGTWNVVAFEARNNVGGIW